MSLGFGLVLRTKITVVDVWVRRMSWFQTCHIQKHDIKWGRVGGKAHYPPSLELCTIVPWESSGYPKNLKGRSSGVISNFSSVLLNYNIIILI